MKAWFATAFANFGTWIHTIQTSITAHTGFALSSPKGLIAASFGVAFAVSIISGMVSGIIPEGFKLIGSLLMIIKEATAGPSGWIFSLTVVGICLGVPVAYHALKK